MKILMISTDSQIFHEESAARQRIKEYSQLVEELHVVVFALASHKTTKERIGNLFIYPTNSRCKTFYIWDAIKTAADTGLNTDWLITSQDPFETGAAGLALKREYGSKLQIQIHTDFLSPYFWRQSWKNLFRRVYWGTRLLKKADCIRVVSERIKTSIVSRGIPASRVAVLPILVDIEKFKNAELVEKREDDFLILTVARFEPEKNLKFAVDSVAALMKENEKVRYMIIGAGSGEVKLLKHIKQLGLTKRIAIKQASSGDLPKWYKRADLFLLTSNYEGYGMAAIEAAAASAPVVMTDVGVAIGRTVPVGDKKRLAEVLKELVINPDKRENLIKEQNRLFQNWPTKEEYLNQMKKLWQNCCL